MRNLMGGVAAVALLSSGGVAFANGDGGCFNKSTLSYEDCPGDNDFYLSLFGGASFVDKVDSEVTVAANKVKTGQEVETGWLIGAALGAKVGEQTRLELEASYASYGADESGYDLNGVSLGNFSTSGDFDAVFLMANLWYDIATESSFAPYFGGGIGAAFVDSDLAFDIAPNVGAFGDEAAFAWQLGAGVKYGVAPDLALELGYRFRSIEDAELQVFNPNIAGASTDTDSIHSHNVLLGLTYNFGLR